MILVNHGYKIAIHFDPIIYIDNWESEYKSLVDKIFQYIKPEDIMWFSLGTFRYTSELKSMIQYNYYNSVILSEEFMECKDKKFRYFRLIRENIYRTMVQYLNKYSNNIPLYLCMESPEVWQKVINSQQKKNLKIIF